MGKRSPCRQRHGAHCYTEKWPSGSELLPLKGPGDMPSEGAVDTKTIQRLIGGNVQQDGHDDASHAQWGAGGDRQNGSTRDLPPHGI